MKQHQLIAIEKGEKDQANRAVTDAYQRLQAHQLMVGIARRFTPIDEGGEERPAENQRVQVTASTELEKIRDGLIPYWNLAASKDETNTRARADVALPDGKVVLEAVSTPTLLWLEKQLVDLRTILGAVPQLDPSREWEYDVNSGAYRATPEETLSQKKIPKFQVLYEATKEHAAQIREYTDDVPVGKWTTTHYSGGLPADKIKVMHERVATLLKAVQIAREEANSTTVVDKKIGDPIFDFLLAP